MGSIVVLKRPGGEGAYCGDMTIWLGENMGSKNYSLIENDGSKRIVFWFENSSHATSFLDGFVFSDVAKGGMRDDNPSLIVESVVEMAEIFTVTKRPSGPARMWGVEGVGWSREDCDKALAWIDENIPGSLIAVDRLSVFTFNNKIDAVAFKLAWGGQ